METENNILFSYHSPNNNDERFFVSHCHLYYELLYIVNGEIEINLEGVQFHMEKGSALLIPPQKYHTVLRSNSTGDRLVIEFPDSAVAKEIKEKFEKVSENISLIRNEESIDILQKLGKYLYTQDSNMTYRTLLHALFVELIYSLTENEPCINQKPPQPHPVIEKILGYIEENLDRNITINDIAKKFFLSPSSVSHLFKQQMKISVKQYALNKKMIYASKLIQEGIPLNIVAERCGYFNYSSFYKIFLKFNETMPSELNKRGPL